MKDVYLYLDPEQKAAIKKLSVAKRLSMSTIVDIIFMYWATSTTEKKYIHKGTEKTKVHLRKTDLWDESKSLDLWVNNSLQNWFVNRKDTTNERNKKIQSELDKREGTEPYWNYNEYYRMLHRYEKERKQQ